jgi:amidase
MRISTTPFLSLCLCIFFLQCQSPSIDNLEEVTNDFPFLEYTIDQFQEGYREGSFTVTEVVQAYLDRIEAMDQSGPELNSMIALNPDALEIAARLDQELADGKPAGLCTALWLRLRTTWIPMIRCPPRLAPGRWRTPFPCRIVT